MITATFDDEREAVAKDFNGRINLDVRDSVPDWDAFTAEKAPEGAPNVLVVLYDDTGCAAWSPYGGRIEMPTLQRLADDGLTYSQWHTPTFEFSGGAIKKVVFDVADDVYIDVERHLAAAMARD